MSAQRVEIWKEGKCIRHSKNLRGLIRYGHKNGVREVRLERHPPKLAEVIGEGCLVWMEFQDGAVCSTDFADFSVARDFFCKRARRWGGLVRTSEGVIHA